VGRGANIQKMLITTLHSATGVPKLEKQTFCWVNILQSALLQGKILNSSDKVWEV
jgi:hypothetical protein